MDGRTAARRLAGRLEALQEAMEARAMSKGRRPRVEALARVVARLDSIGRAPWARGRHARRP